MRRKPQKPRDKPFFCHDENLEFYSLRKQCSREGRFKSIVKIVKRQGAADSEVIALCDKKDLHIITHNTKHFQRPKTGIKNRNKNRNYLYWIKGRILLDSKIYKIT